MAVKIEFEEVAKGLDGDGGPGNGVPLRHRFLKKEFQGSPGAAAHIGKKVPVTKKIPIAPELRGTPKGYHQQCSVPLSIARESGPTNPLKRWLARPPFRRLFHR